VLSHGQGERALSDRVFANLYLLRRVHDYRLLPGPLAQVQVDALLPKFRARLR
jgi:hypothetical protein